MSVRSSILAVLTLGPAYGLQVHDEIEARTARDGEINVGQIYSTLTRLRSAGLVTADSLTDDGLPLYELTPDGRADAEQWLTCAPSVSAASFQLMVQHVLLVGSLPAGDLGSVVAGYLTAWRELAGPETSTGATVDALTHLGDSLVASAAEEWLSVAATAAIAPRPYGSARPKRGRRPK